MDKKRPVNLALHTIYFPYTAIASILHRISGIILFLLIPAGLYLLGKSLESPEGFREIAAWLTQPMIKLTIWLTLTALFYHLFAGVRHLLMDFGFGEDVEYANKTAIGVIVITAVVSIGLGVWLW